jgi:membrane-associated protease RseP (regulator of RpoE activity)
MRIKFGVVSILIVLSIFMGKTGAQENLALDKYTCAEFLHDTTQSGNGNKILKSMMMISWATGYASGMRMQQKFARADAGALILMASALGAACRKNPDQMGTEVIARLVQQASLSKPAAAGSKPRLGVTIQSGIFTDKNNVNVRLATGAIVVSVRDNSPAKAAGIERDDLIIKFDGKNVKDAPILHNMVIGAPADKDIAVTIIRKGKELTKTVKLGRLDSGQKQVVLTPKKSAFGAPRSIEELVMREIVKKALGLNLINISEELRKKYKINDKVKGVLIFGVDPNSPAAEKRLAPGMVIAEVQTQPVDNVTKVEQRVESLKEAGRKAAVLLVLQPNGNRRFVQLSLH